MTEPLQKSIDLQAESEARASHNTMQYVTFMVGDRCYGVDINQVREIKQWQQTTVLPNQPHYTRGVLNLRGTIVPVHDLRARFGGELTEATDTHVVVIVCIDDQIVGVLVDAVSDIVTVDVDDIRTVPSSGGPEQTSLTGLVDNEGQMVALLALHALFAMETAA